MAAIIIAPGFTLKRALHLGIHRLLRVREGISSLPFQGLQTDRNHQGGKVTLTKRVGISGGIHRGSGNPQFQL